MKNKIISCVCAMAMLFSLCAIPQTEAQAAVKKVYVTRGESVKLSVKKAAKKTAWKVSKSGIVKLTRGKNSLSVKAKKKGAVIVSAKIKGKTKKYKIIVETPKLSNNAMSLKEGESGKISITGTKRSVKWKSKDSAVASVTAAGIVEAKGVGHTSIYTKLGTKTYRCNVTITPKAKEQKKKDENTKKAKTTETKETTKKERTEMEVQTLQIPNKDRSIYGKIYYPAGSGSYPAVILSHGYNGSANDFDKECRYYAQNGYIAYTFDFCGGNGLGRSKGLSSTEMTIFTEKEDLLAVFDTIYAMDEVDQSRVYLFGGSQGGFVSALAAEERADKVRAMALYFPALCIPDNWRTNYPTLDNVPETFDFWGLTLGREFVVSIHDFYTFDNIGNYKGNVYILHGDKDPIVPLSYSERAVELYPHAKLKVMENEKHGFTPAGGELAMEEVLAFMEENKTAPLAEEAFAPVPDGYLTAIDQKGTVTTIEYEGTQANGTVAKKTAYVYLPYGYDESKQYDILYALHGGEGNTKAYLGTENSPADVKKMLDHMILNGEIKPMIVVAPTYYLGADQSDAVGKIENFTKNELVNELIPAVEGTYSTYAETTDAEGLKASRAHRGYTGFSMGALSTWRTFLNSSDYFYFYMPMSGDCWINGVSNAKKAALELEAHCVEKDYSLDDFLIYAVTGSKDIAYQAMNNQINAMKTDSPSFQFITEDGATGNISFNVQLDAEHSYVYLPLYLYNGLRTYFAPDGK